MRFCSGVGPRTLDKSLSELFPELLDLSRPILTPETPLIVAASILAARDTPILPLSKAKGALAREGEGVHLFKAVGGFQVIRLVVRKRPTEYQAALLKPCTDASMWLGALDYDDSLGSLLQIFEVTGFGDARVTCAAPPHVVVTLDEVVSLFRKGLRCNMRVGEVGSEAVFASPDATLFEAMKTMCERRVRRLFLRGRRGEYLSDRAVLAYLFSPRALAELNESPEAWADVPLSRARTATAKRLSREATVEEAGLAMRQGAEVFILPGGTSLVSKWDLVMKPWRSGRLRLSGD